MEINGRINRRKRAGVADGDVFRADRFEVLFANEVGHNWRNQSAKRCANVTTVKNHLFYQRYENSIKNIILEKTEVKIIYFLRTRGYD